jgi:hypothetical protein
MFQRQLRSQVAALADTRVEVLGARQARKSTLMESVAAEEYPAPVLTCALAPGFGGTAAST